MQFQRSQGANLFGELGDDFLEPAAFGSRDPFETHAVAIDTQLLKQQLRQGHAAHALVVPFDVVAVAGMTAADQHAVGAAPEGVEDKCRIDPTGAHHANAGHIGRIVHARSAGQIGAGIAAPVAEKADNSRFKAHDSIPSICA